MNFLDSLKQKWATNTDGANPFTMTGSSEWKSFY